MKKKSPGIMQKLVVFSFMFIVTVSGIIVPKSVAQQLPDVPQCPSDFFGNPVCDAFDLLNNTLSNSEVLDQLIDFNDQLYLIAQEELEKRVNDAASQVNFGPAINFFNQSVQLAEPIINATDEFLNHPVCGSEAALNELEEFFIELGDISLEIVNMGMQIGESALLLEPTIGSSLTIAAQMQQIANKPKDLDSDTFRKLRELELALTDLNDALAYIGEKEGFKAATTGIEASQKVIPFSIACVACVKSVIVGSKGTSQAATGATAVTTACPSTAVAYGGACWSSVIIPQGMLEAFFGVLASLPSCGGVKKKIPTIPMMLLKSYKFAEASWNLGVALSDTYEKWNRAAIALAEFADAWEEDSQQELQTIQDEMNNIGQALHNTINSIEPIINQSVELALNTFEQTGRRVGDLIDCYNLMNEMVASVSVEMLQAIEGRIPIASTGLTTGMSEFENLLNQLNVANQAVSSAGVNERNEIINSIEQIIENLVGRPPHTPERMFDHITHNLTNSNWIPGLIHDITSLNVRISLISNVLLNEGIAALSGLQNYVTSSTDNFQTARNESIAAIQILNNPPSPPMASLDLIDNPGFPFTPPQLAAGNITQVNWQELDIDFNPGIVNLETRTLKDHLEELSSVRYREIIPRGQRITDDPCLTCARDFDMYPVKDKILKAPPRGGVTVVIVNRRGAEVVNLGSYSSIDSIPPMQRVEAPRGGFSNDSFGCNLEIEIRDARGQSLARSPVCVDSM